MNEIQQLESLGLSLPSPAYLAGAIVFGIVGYIAFRRGRKNEAPPLTWSGLALMLYPYGVSQAWLLWLLGGALSLWVYAKWN
jgi:hypothetical protein